MPQVIAVAVSLVLALTAAALIGSNNQTPAAVMVDDGTQSVAIFLAKGTPDENSR